MLRAQKNQISEKPFEKTRSLRRTINKSRLLAFILPAANVDQ
jgi:hypothetical protein